MIAAAVLAMLGCTNMTAQQQGTASRAAIGGVVGGTAGVGVPGIGVVDPSINQPGAAGNVGRPGVGAPGVGVADPGINQPGAAGNVGAPGVGRDPGVNQPGEAGNRRRVVR